MSQLKLRSLEGADEIDLGAAKGDVIVGRDAHCDHPLADPRASRRHCRFLHESGEWWIEDLGSANGTWVNGERIERRALAPEDVVKIADTIYEVIGDRADRREEGEGAVSVATSDDDSALESVELESSSAESPGHESEARPTRRRRGQGRTSRTASSTGSNTTRNLKLVGFLVVLVLGAGKMYLRMKKSEDQRDRIEARGEGRSREPGLPRQRSESKPDVVASRVVRPAGGNSAERSGENSRGHETSVTRVREPERDEKSQHDVELERATKLATEGDYRRSIGILEQLQRSDPALASSLRSVKKQAETQLGATIKTSRDFAAAGEYDRARRGLLESLGRFPPEFAERAMEALDEMVQVESERQESRSSIEGRVTRAIVRLRHALGRFDFEAAIQVLGELEKSGDASAELEKIVEDARLLWARITDRIDGRRGETMRFVWERRGVELILPGQKIVAATDEPFEAGIIGLEGGRVLFHLASDSKDTVRSREILSLSPFTLWTEFIQNKSDSSDEALRLYGGFLALILIREGMWAMKETFELDSGGIVYASDAKYLELFDLSEFTESTAYSADRFSRVQDLERQLQKIDSPQKLQELALAAAESRVLWRLSTSMGASSEHRIDPIYVDARARMMRSHPPSEAFFARKVVAKDGLLTISYDFEDSSQIQAFQVVRWGCRKPVVLEKSLVVDCELKYFVNFEDELRVRIELPARGYNRSAPNVVIGLWTSVKTELKPDGRGGRSVLSQSLQYRGGRSNVIAFATGYSEVTATYAGKEIKEIIPVGSSSAVPFPANALFGLEARQALHAATDECVWAKSLAQQRKSRGVLKIDVGMTPSDIIWTVDGKDLLSRDLDEAPRLFSGSKRLGSFHIYSRDKVRITRMVITGRPEPEWYRWQLRRQARRELKSF